jgi:hypothetical protein
LTPETSFKFTDKHKRLRQLVWRPYSKGERCRKKKEVNIRNMKKRLEKSNKERSF